MYKIGFSRAIALGAVVTSSAVADIVQWSASEGGNGHWYESVRLGTWPSGPGSSWGWCRDAAAVAGGHLATLTSSSENDFVRTRLVVPMDPGVLEAGPQLGGLRVRGEWTWITGEPWTFDAFGGLEPTGDGEALEYWRWCCLWWNDRDATSWDPRANTYIIEWSDDCNGDGIVDFGQIRRGELADVNGDARPDCCDLGGGCDPCLGDLDGDGHVAASDLGPLLRQWGRSDAGVRGDLDGDGMIGGGDLAMLLGAWGDCLD